MGGFSSKSPLERRNTVLRRSQRKSIHGIKSKCDKILKEISKFKDIESNTKYEEILTKIESAQKDLQVKSKELQPELQNIYHEARIRLENCRQALEDKLKDNQAAVEPDKHEEELDDNVFVEEIEPNKPVELNIVRIEASPQVHRQSVLKHGVPVMPGSIIESMKRRESGDLNADAKVKECNRKVVELEDIISRFMGHKNGRYYNKIKQDLHNCLQEINSINGNDEDVSDRSKRCRQYIESCLNFLEERATDGGTDDDPDYDDVPTPRSIKTTYI